MSRTIKLKDDTYIANDIYNSSNQMLIGTWIDYDGTEYKLYRKIIDLGNLPNTDAIRVDIGVHGGFITDIRAYMKKNSMFALLPYYDPQGNSVSMWVENHYLYVYALGNRNSYRGTAIIEYVTT